MRSSRVALVALTVHVALVTACAASLALAFRDVGTADGGADLALNGLAGLGMPWSLLVLLEAVPWRDGNAAQATALTMFALANLLLHGVLSSLLARDRPSP